MTLRGGPDYGVWAPKDTVTALVDLAELAARLQSPYVFDRRGDVVFMDDFEDPPLKWLVDLYEISAVVERSSITAFSGGWSARLRTGHEEGNTATMEKRIFEPESRRCGLTAYLCTPVDPPIAEMSMGLPTKGVFHEGAIRLTALTRRIEYLSPENRWVTLAPLPSVPRAHHAFWPVKLILDFEKATYHEFLLGPFSYNMEHIPLHRRPGWGAFRSRIRFRAITECNLNKDLFVDNVVFTRNEP